MENFPNLSNFRRIPKQPKLLLFGSSLNFPANNSPFPNIEKNDNYNPNYRNQKNEDIEGRIGEKRKGYMKFPELVSQKVCFFLSLFVLIILILKVIHFFFHSFLQK